MSEVKKIQEIYRVSMQVCLPQHACILALSIVRDMSRLQVFKPSDRALTHIAECKAQLVYVG